MIEKRVHQVVVPPGTDRTLIDQINERIAPFQKPTPRIVKVRLLIGYIFHPVMHTWVTWNQYDPSADRLVDMGLTCMFCPAGRAR